MVIEGYGKKKNKLNMSNLFTKIEENEDKKDKLIDKEGHGFGMDELAQ